MPRADWAHLAPLATASRRDAPATFDGARFGRTVAGARDLRERPHVRRGSAPAGVLLDIAEVETVLPPAPSTPPSELPSVVVEHAPVVHRKPVVAPAPAAALTSSEVVVDFAPYRDAPSTAASVDDASWTLDDGFTDSSPEPPAPSRMRLVGRRGSFDDAVRQADEPVDDDADPELDEPALRYVPIQGPRRTAPPRDLVDLVQQVTGEHVGDAVIDRSDESSRTADEIGAIAYTLGTTVHLPAELGPIDDPVVRGVAAHELTHVAQQRARGGDVPPEATDAGRVLEAQARAVQRRVTEASSPVRPAFMRPRSRRPEAPVGVQRLEPGVEWWGEDYADADMSDVEPGSGDDLFAWQERVGEPTGVEWDERREWAAAFERSNAAQLQLRRDERFHELAGGQRLDHDDSIRVRRRLDRELPYQFGPPFSIEPYPEPLPDGGRAGSGGGAGGGGPGGGGRTARTVPDETEAETRAGTDVLGDIATGAALAHLRAPSGRVSGLGGIEDRLRQRLELEEELRRQVLDAKLSAALDERAADDHVVGLSSNEIDEIREAVDLRLPLDVDYPQYMDTDHVASVSMAGVYGPLIQATPRGRGGRGGPGGEGRTPPRTGGDRPPTDSGADGDEPRADEAAAATTLEGIIDAARDLDRSAAGVQYSLQELLAVFERRRTCEIRHRQTVLREKIQVARQRRAPIEYVATLTDEEIQQIRQAVDLEFPVNVDYPQYVGVDEYASLSMTGEYGPQREVEELPEPPDPAAAAAQVAGATPPTPDTPAPTDGNDADRAADGATTDLVAATGDAGASTELPSSAASDAVPEPAATGIVAAAAAPAGVLAAAAVRAFADAASPHVGEEQAEMTVESLTELDLEVLARRLWGRMRRELRAELLIDRERAGSLADIR